MSRSRRKTPVIGITTAHSEKQDKRWHNRLLRRKAHQTIRLGDELFPVKNEVSSTWDMAKDGKRRFYPRSEPKLLRK
jgi:hypothetical protein